MRAFSLSCFGCCLLADLFSWTPVNLLLGWQFTCVLAGLIAFLCKLTRWFVSMIARSLTGWLSGLSFCTKFLDYFLAGKLDAWLIIPCLAGYRQEKNNLLADYAGSCLTCTLGCLLVPYLTYKFEVDFFAYQLFYLQLASIPSDQAGTKLSFTYIYCFLHACLVLWLDHFVSITCMLVIVLYFSYLFDK